MLRDVGESKVAKRLRMQIIEAEMWKEKHRTSWGGSSVQANMLASVVIDATAVMRRDGLIVTKWKW